MESKITLKKKGGEVNRVTIHYLMNIFFTSFKTSRKSDTFLVHPLLPTPSKRKAQLTRFIILHINIHNPKDLIYQFKIFYKIPNTGFKVRIHIF